jgi:hypothetical protein
MPQAAGPGPISLGFGTPSAVPQAAGPGPISLGFGTPSAVPQAAGPGPISLGFGTPSAVPQAAGPGPISHGDGTFSLPAATSTVHLVPRSPCPSEPCDIRKNGTRFTFRVGCYNRTWTEAADDKALILVLYKFFNLEGASKGNKGEMSKKVKNHLDHLDNLKFPMQVPLPAGFSASSASGLAPNNGSRPVPADIPCAISGCKYCVSPGRVYCTKSHHKYQFLYEARCKFLAEKDSFGVYLVDSICKGKTMNSNPLQPVNGSAPMGSPPPEFIHLLDWYHFMKKYQSILHAALGVKLDGTENKKLIDQKLRAEYLASMFRPGFHSIIRYMDGFGGFTLLLLEQLCMKYGESVLTTFHLEIVDIVPEVTLWHQNTFRCVQIHCQTEKIVDIHRPLISSSPLTTTRTLLYMNFCGIKESFNEVVTYLQHYPMECLLSFSLQRKGNLYEKKLYGHLLNTRYCTWQVRKMSTNRKDFGTYHVERK